MKKRNLFKLAALTAVFAFASMFANAQITNADNDTLHRNTDETKVVKVIDNKGTVKYIQSMNGITQITSTDAGYQTTTTFQLGGTLTNDVTLNVDDQQFNILGIDTVMTSGAPTYELLVTDPVTGNLRRLAFDGLIKSGRTVQTVATDQFTSTYAITMTGITLDPNKVYVYRNGAKLLATTDYTIIANTVQVNASASLPLYVGDIIEVHYVK